MRKSTRLLKRFAALFLVVLMSINNFASIVSDNDGSAFVSKAEFENLKGSLNRQVDNYNSSIDNKIDGYIASYIDGVRIAKREKLENKYNLISPTWMKDKRFSQSHKGLKATVFISFIEASFSGNWLCYCFEGTATGWYQNKSLVKNADDQEYLYRVQKKQIGKFNDQWALQDLIKSDYSITIGGGAAGGRGGGSNFSTQNRLLFPDHTIFEKPNSQKYFGTWYGDLPVAVWSINNSSVTKTSKLGYITGSTGTGETPAITAIAKDVIENNTSVFYLAGGSMPNDTMYCLNVASASEIGEDFISIKSNAGASRQMWYPNWSYLGTINWFGGYYDDTEVSKPHFGNIETKVYRHVIQELNAADLLNETITQNTGEKSYYYSGCPIFTATDNGTVEFKIKFKNTASAKTKWALSSDKFANETNPGDCGDIEDCNETTFLADADEIRNVKFTVKKDVTYWIKAEPQSGYTTIEFDGDINQVGE